jgi:hypothetical protein
MLRILIVANWLMLAVILTLLAAVVGRATRSIVQSGSPGKALR